MLDLSRIPRLLTLMLFALMCSDGSKLSAVQKCALNDKRSSTACMKCPVVAHTTLDHPLNS